MGLGTILVNIPASGVLMTGDAAGPFQILFDAGIETEPSRCCSSSASGAMIDFGPLLANPFLLLFGAAAQFGIFFVIIVAAGVLGFHINDAASIGIIAAADGPTSIFVANTLGSKYMGAIMVAAYSYMALVPIIQPVAIKAVTTKKERRIRMNYHPGQVSKTAKDPLFPIIICVVAGLIAPVSLPLVGFLMFGNLLRECGVLDRLSVSAQNELVNLISILLGLCVSVKMVYTDFLQFDTLLVMGLGLLGFCDGLRGRRHVRQVPQSLPQGEDQPDGGRCGHLRVPDELSRHPEDGHRGTYPATSSSCRLPAPTSLARSPRLLPAVSCSACCSKGKGACSSMTIDA